jgi:cyclophilin family peptidyl-prolyl cis-trans isomerase
MKRAGLIFFLVCGITLAKAQTFFVDIVTEKGTITVMLYDETPEHRDAFIKGIQTGLFKGALFNRVIKNFVSQGGELDETILDREKLHPELPLKRIAAEIKPNLYHKKGALGMGRNDNPEKKSYLNQIYLVQGKKQTDATLDAITTKTGHQFTAAQRETYKTIGGSPELDGDYTIFGEVVQGIEVAEAINAVPTVPVDLPASPIQFKLQLLSKKEVQQKIKHLK